MSKKKWVFWIVGIAFVGLVFSSIILGSMGIFIGWIGGKLYIITPSGYRYLGAGENLVIWYIASVGEETLTVQVANNGNEVVIVKRVELKYKDIDIVWDEHYLNENFFVDSDVRSRSLKPSDRGYFIYDLRGLELYLARRDTARGEIKIIVTTTKGTYESTEGVISD